MDHRRRRPAAARVFGALTPIIAGAEDHFVQHYADKLPHTHGAPVKHDEPLRDVIAAE
jgi:hypothetical protein